MQKRRLTPALVKLQKGTANQAGEGRVEGTASKLEQRKFKMEDCMNKDNFELAPEINEKETAENLGYCGKVFVCTECKQQKSGAERAGTWKL